MVPGQSAELVQPPLHSPQPTGSGGSVDGVDGRQVLPSLSSTAGPGRASGPSACGVGAGVCDALSGAFWSAALAALSLVPPARLGLDDQCPRKPQGTLLSALRRRFTLLVRSRGSRTVKRFPASDAAAGVDLARMLARQTARPILGGPSPYGGLHESNCRVIGLAEPT